jgi:hypothetical protein
LRVPASVRERLGAAALGFVLVVLMTYPTVPLASSVGRFDTGDGRFSVWNIAWVAHALTSDPRHVLDANIYAPHTGTLAYSELNLVAGLFAVPFWLVSGSPIVAANGAIALTLWLAFWCMWALARRLTGQFWPAVLAATIYTFCPYLLAHTAHIQLLMAFVLPFMFLALHRFIEAPTPRRAAELGAAVAVSGLASGYYGVYGGVALGVAALWFGRRMRAYWVGLAGAVALAAAIVAPVMIAYRAARADVGGGRIIEDTELAYYAARLSDYLVSGSWLHGLLLPHQSTYTDVLFPGVVVLLLAASLAARALGRRLGAHGDAWTIGGYAVVGLVGFWASFGPKAGLYLVLDRAVPAMDLLRAPSRFAIVAMFALAILAAFAVSPLRRRWWTVALLAALVAAESGARTEAWGFPSWPLQRLDPPSRVYAALAALPKGAVVEYPFPYRSNDYHSHTKAMLWSTFHWQPLVNGYSDVVPRDFEEIALPINAFPDDGSFAIMARYGVKYVVWHVDTYDAESFARLSARFPPYAAYLKPIIKDRDTWLYEITTYPNR